MWLGPATVVAQDGKVIFVRHGGNLIRLSPNRIQKFICQDLRLDQILEGEIIQQKTNDHVSDCDEIKPKAVETDDEEGIIPFCERVEGDSTEVEVPVPKRSLRILNKERN